MLDWLPFLFRCPMRPSAPHRSALATHRLSRAVARGDTAAALRLLAGRADANALVGFRWSAEQPLVRAPALFVAVQRQDTGLLQGLLDARASVEVRVHLDGRVEGLGHTLLDVVTRQEDLLRLLSAGMLWHQPSGAPSRDMVLHVAARRSWTEVVKWVARRCEFMDVRNAAGQTPLHVAVSERLEISQRARRQFTIRALIEGGSSWRAVDPAGRTVVQTALHQCPEMLPVLVECGALLQELGPFDQERVRQLPTSLHQRLEAASSFRRLRQHPASCASLGRMMA